MPTLNQLPLNSGLVNGPALASLPVTEEVCLGAFAAEYEIEIPGRPPAFWELSFSDLIAAWEMPFTAEIKEC